MLYFSFFYSVHTWCSLPSASLMYHWYRQWQINWFIFTQHVAKKNRWQVSDQAIGYRQSDFNPKIIKSGLFNYKPQGQHFRAGTLSLL
jgi:hypothetical protein